MKRIILSILLVSLFSCKTEKKQEEVKETFALSDKMLASTETAAVSKDFLKNELNFFGKITADNNKMIEVYPVVGGNVTKVFVELGDYVHKGQLLATIRSTDVAEFQKDYEDAKNDVIVAKSNLKVAQELFDGKLNTEREVIEAKSELEKAQAQLSRTNETFKVYNIKKGATYEVRSPLNGFIIQKKINQDMLLRSDRSDNIFDIAEINDVWAVANVNEVDINQVKTGIDAEVTTMSYPDKKFYGKVDKIFNVIDPDTKAMKATIKLSNAGFLLKPEMRATIKLFYNENQKMLDVPVKALIFDKNKNFVMIFKDRNNIETRQVEVFRQVGDKAYISNGVELGEKVITHNQMLIYSALND